MLLLLFLVGSIAGSEICKESYGTHLTYVVRIDTFKKVQALNITCSNVPPNLRFNYTQKDPSTLGFQPSESLPTPNEYLEIRDSEIRVVPANSSLSMFPHIIHLNLSYLGIERIEPDAFNCFDRLRRLYLAGNKLTHIRNEFGYNLGTLKVLDMSHNQITDLNTVVFRNLDQLHLQDNKLLNLRQIDLFLLKRLEWLEVSDNPLEEFPETKFTRMVRLDASNANLRNFKAKLPRLEYVQVDLSGNFLSSVNFKHFPQVKKLDLSSNLLDKLINLNSTHCNNLDLTNNDITTLSDFPANGNMIELGLNGITRLENATSNSSLVYLNLTQNQISEIEFEAFWGLPNLKAVVLRGNHLTKIRADIFSRNPLLEFADFSRNLIKEIESNAFRGTNLMYLTVAHNQLKTLNLEMLPKENHLENILFEGNEISEFDHEEFCQYFTSIVFVVPSNFTCHK